MTTEATNETTKRERQKERRRKRAEEQRRESQRRRVVRMIRNVVLAVVAVVVVFGAAVWLGRGVDVTLGVDEPEVAADAEPLPPLEAAGAQDPAVGQPAPPVTGMDPDGNPVQIGEGSGQAQAIGFMAHWCPHCQEEVPEVAGWVDSEPLPEGVELVAVSTEHEPSRPNWPSDEWLAEEGWPGPVLVDSTNAVNEAYAMAGTPYWVFVDADGTVISRTSGRIGEPQFRQVVEELAAR